MGHTTRNRDKLLQREQHCGTLVGLIEDHVREHIADPDQRPGSARAEATQELLDVVRSYFK